MSSRQRFLHFFLYIKRILNNFWNWVKTIGFSKFIQNLSHLATTVGLIWAIFTFVTSQEESDKKERQNVLELSRIRKNDSLQIDILAKQLMKSEERDQWNFRKDSLSLEYSRRNLDSLSSNTSKSIRVSQINNQDYLKTFNSIYKRMIQVEERQAEALSRSYDLQKSVNNGLLSFESIKILNINAKNLEQGHSIMVNGNMNLSNLGTNSVKDVTVTLSALLTITDYENGIYTSHPTDRAYLISVENEPMAEYSGINSGESIAVPFKLEYVNSKDKLTYHYEFICLAKYTFNTLMTPETRTELFRPFKVTVHRSNDKYDYTVRDRINLTAQNMNILKSHINAIENNIQNYRNRDY